MNEIYKPVNPNFFQIGWYSEDEGLHINEDVELAKIEPVTTTVAPITAPRSSPLVNSDNNNDRTNNDRSIDEDKFRKKTQKSNVVSRTTIKEDLSHHRIATYESFMERTWSLVVVSEAIFSNCISMGMLVYVFIRNAMNVQMVFLKFVPYFPSKMMFPKIK